MTQNKQFFFFVPLVFLVSLVSLVSRIKLLDFFVMQI